MACASASQVAAERSEAKPAGNSAGVHLRQWLVGSVTAAQLTVEAELQDRDAAAKGDGRVIEQRLPVPRHVTELEHANDALVWPNDQTANRRHEAGIPLNNTLFWHTSPHFTSGSKR